MARIDYDGTYKAFRKQYASEHTTLLKSVIHGVNQNAHPVFPERAVAVLDAATDELMKRGVGAPVLSFFSKEHRHG